MPDEDLKEVTIRVDKSSGNGLDDIASRLRALGLQDVQVLNRVLMIHGRILASSIPRLQEVEGVASVRESSRFRPAP